MRSNRLSYAPEVTGIIAQVTGFGKILLFLWRRQKVVGVDFAVLRVHQFKMQVRAGRVACAAHRADQLALADTLTTRNIDLT